MSGVYVYISYAGPLQLTVKLYTNAESFIEGSKEI